MDYDPAIKCLRVKLGDKKEDSKCKRRVPNNYLCSYIFFISKTNFELSWFTLFSQHTAIAKLLEGESIAWSKEDDGLVLMIRIDEIDPEKLSFAKK